MSHWASPHGAGSKTIRYDQKLKHSHPPQFHERTVGQEWILIAQKAKGNECIVVSNDSLTTNKPVLRLSPEEQAELDKQIIEIACDDVVFATIAPNAGIVLHLVAERRYTMRCQSGEATVEVYVYV